MRNGEGAGAGFCFTQRVLGLFLLLCRAENPAGHGSKEVKGKTHTYYQVLIDARDCPHIVSEQDVWVWGSSLWERPEPRWGEREGEGSNRAQISTGPQVLRTG